MESGHTPIMTDADLTAARTLSAKGVRPPVRVPGYGRESFVGHGAYGEVWAATDTNSGRKVAIKFYNRRGGLDWATLAREVEKLRYLFNDRHVVQLIKVGWEAEPPYYVMEYMEHGSLEDLLRTGPLPVSAAVNLFRECAVGLVHAHDKGILHCDLKPANILLDQDRRPRLADFGQSRLTGDASPALGTLFYMAPEQADLAAVPDARWDVYALGAVMYRILTGNAPYRGEPGAGDITAAGNLGAQLAAYRRLIEAAPRPAGHRAVHGVDGGLAEIIDRCLAVNPANRFPNPQAVLSATDAWTLRRARRPFLALAWLSFAAIVLVLAAIGSMLLRDAVSVAEAGVTDRALDGNRFAARIEAQQLGLQVQYRWQILEQEARDPNLRKWLAATDELRRTPASAEELDAWLAKRRAKYDAQFEEAGRSSVWFADDRRGLRCGSDPANADRRFAYRGFHDYFHGTGKELADDPQSPPPPITGPHRSIAFRRQSLESEAVWSVAFSVPVWEKDDARGTPIGVLGLTLDLRGQTRLAGERERFAVLVDTRPDATGRRGLIVRHPYLERYRSSDRAVPLPLHYADAVVRWADDRSHPFAAERGYRDPADGQRDGDWLAAVHPVTVRRESGTPVNTDWVVVVQERQDETLQPVRRLQWRLGYGAMFTVGCVLVLGLVLWGGMIYVQDTASRTRLTRLLRRWAGLSKTGDRTQETGDSTIDRTGS